MENLPNIEELKLENGTMKMASKVLAWGKKLTEENERLKSELERLKEEKFNWYERENLLPLPDDMPNEKKIKNLTWRLWQAKKANKQLRQTFDAVIEKTNQEKKVIEERYRKAVRFEYDDKSFEGLLDFSHNIRQYLLSGLKHMKSCSSCLDKTCPDDIMRKKDENGEFIKKIESLGSETYIWTGYEEKPKEEYRKEWGTILSKMIRALEIKERCFEKEFTMTDKEKAEVKEGMELLVKYQDEFLY